MNDEKIRNVIWEGRFQPFHRGHLAYIERLTTYAERVWIIVVANETSGSLGLRADDLPVPEFTAAVDPHHVDEKNPLPFWLRYRLLQETLLDELPHARITTWGGRRLDLDWSFYAKTLPPERAFLTPLRDDFEDVKARAWKALGEDVLRISVDDLPRISGTQVRAAFKEGKSMEALLCPRTIAVLEETGFLDQLGALT